MMKTMKTMMTMTISRQRHSNFNCTRVFFTLLPFQPAPLAILPWSHHAFRLRFRKGKWHVPRGLPVDGDTSNHPKNAVCLLLREDGTRGFQFSCAQHLSATKSLANLTHKVQSLQKKWCWGSSSGIWLIGFTHSRFSGTEDFQERDFFRIHPKPPAHLRSQTPPSVQSSEQKRSLPSWVPDQMWRYGPDLDRKIGTKSAVLKVLTRSMRMFQLPLWKTTQGCDFKVCFWNQKLSHQNLLLLKFLESEGIKRLSRLQVPDGKWCITFRIWLMVWPFTLQSLPSNEYRHTPCTTSRTTFFGPMTSKNMKKSPQPRAYWMGPRLKQRL